MTGSVTENTAHHHNNRLHIILSSNSPSVCVVTGVSEICKLRLLKGASRLLDLQDCDL